MKRNPVQRFSFVPSVFLAIILLFPSFLDVSAQDGNDIWSTPVNLSHSGGTTNPVILVDANQFIHLVWEDRYSGYMHVRGDGEQCSAPRPADLPLDDLSKPPVLLADSQNVIHAFWIDDHNTLFYSSIESRDIGISGKWENQVILGKHVINFSAHVDQDAVVHIAYLVARDTTETPAGIYYVQVTTRGKRPESFPIHQSPYFRRLSDDSEQDQITDLLPISLDIDTGAVNGSTTVFVAWNNPILKRISHRESMDGGETWQDTQDVARPEAVIVDASPQNVHVHADQANIFLTWQYSQSGNCSQFYQFSSDSGVTWDTQREMATRCLEISQFLKSPASGSLLYTNFQNSVFRITWNSPEANPEQVLASFSSFIDPDSYNNIDLQTRQAIILGDKLFMVGSDRGIGGDTWITSAQINIENEGNPRSVSWTKPTTIFTSSLPIYSPQLLVDSSDVLHAFWNQADERYPQGPGMTIFHTNWKDGDHSTPSPILRSPIGKANEQSVSQNSAGQIAIVWSGGESGPIYFSSAPSSGAGISSDWFEPSLLPSPDPSPPLQWSSPPTTGQFTSFIRFRLMKIEGYILQNRWIMEKIGPWRPEFLMGK